MPLAVSGGADSTALVALAVQAGMEVVAIHVDHGLRPGSAREADVVAAAAAVLGAGFESRKVLVAPGPDLEARARAARYAALPGGVLTGHTADDLAETVLLNLLRGAGADGLSAMARPGRAERPLLRLRREETAAVCAALGLRTVTDPTNSDQRHRRNAVRHRLLPVLAEVAARDPVPVLARQAYLLAEEVAWMEAAAAEIDPTDARALCAAPIALARRAVRRWLREGGDSEVHPPSAADVAKVLDVAAGRAVATEVGGGRRVSRHAGRLALGSGGRR